jgi:hypothetical protein
MKPIPLPKIDIPQTWSSAQVLAIIEFLHSVADEIWDAYERPILDLMDRRRDATYDENGNRVPSASQISPENEHEDIPF